MINREGRPRFRTRAYGHHHQVLRRQFVPLVAAGGSPCSDTPTTDSATTAPSMPPATGRLDALCDLAAVVSA